MVFVPPKDRVFEHSTSNSQTVFAVTGALDLSYNAFSASMSVGDTTIGAIVEPGVAFKSGLLTYSATNQVTVTTAYDSKGTFSSSGVKEVFMGMPAADALMVDGPQSLTSARQAQALGNIGGVSSGLVNRFINGGMNVWLMGTTSMTITTAGGTGPEGWILVPTGASITVQQSSGFGLSRNSMFITGATSVTGLIVKQRMESDWSAPLNAQTVTFQLKILNNTGGSITPKATVKYPTAADNYASTTTDTTVSALNLQPCANGATTQVALTFAPTGDARLGMEVTIDLGNNFSASGKTLQIGEMDIRSTPGVAIGLNSNPPVPELRPIPVELPICQRYFESSYDVGVAPGAVTTAGIEVNWSPPASSGLWRHTVKFKVTKRIDPTITVYSPSTGTSGKYRDLSTSVDFTPANAGVFIGQSGCVVSDINNVSASDQIGFHWTASARL